MKEPKNFVGLIFGRWTVLARLPPTKGGQRSLCRCECGTERAVYTANLTKGLSTSCGCLKVEKFVAMTKVTFTTHGKTDTTEYRSWSSMVDRCENPLTPSFRNYGARGISICDRWRDGSRTKSGFELFLKDMGPKPSPDHTLERMNNDLGYFPQNCKWGTRKEQANNQRPKRKAIPDRIKSIVMLRQGCICAECKRPLTSNIQYDHRPALITREVDYARKLYIPDQLDPFSIEAIHDHCHLKRTTGREPGAQKTATHLGSDVWLAKKFRKLESPKKSKRRIASRPFRKGRSSFATSAAKGS